MNNQEIIKLKKKKETNYEIFSKHYNSYVQVRKYRDKSISLDDYFISIGYYPKKTGFAYTF